MYTESSLDLPVIPAEQLPPTNIFYNRGIVPRFNEFRWTVRLLIDSNNEQIVCSGSIIGPKTILTAGSCIYDIKSGSYAKNVKIDFNLTASNPLIISSSSSNKITVDLEKTIVHPLYVDTGNIEHNLALLYLDKSIDFRIDRFGYFNATIKLLDAFPAKPYDEVASRYLPLIDTDGRDGYLELAGYGRSSRVNRTFSALRHYRVYMTSLVDCLYIFNSGTCKPGILTTRNSYFPIANGCSVELGAPLTLSDAADHYGQYRTSRLVGIYTFGSFSLESKSCGGKYLSGFVSVPFNYEWLAMHII